jgi:hypothetical protein
MRLTVGKRKTTTLSGSHTATAVPIPDGSAIALTTYAKGANPASRAFTGTEISYVRIAREKMLFELASTAGSGDAWGGEK